MKKAYLLCIVLLFASSLSAQSWAKSYWNTFDHDAYSSCIGELQDGSLIIAGHLLSNNSGGDILYYKINPEGEVVWKFTLSHSSFEQAIDIAVHPDGGFSLLSWSNVDQISINQFDENGFLLGQHSFLTGTRSFPSECFLLENNDYIINGYTDINEDPDIYDIELFLLRVNFEGNVQYHHTINFEGDNWDIPSSMIIGTDNSLYTSIFTINEDPFSPSDMFICKWQLDDGNPIWQKNLGTGSITDLVLAEDEDYLYAAISANNDGNASNNMCQLARISLDGEMEILTSSPSGASCEPKNLLVLEDNTLLLSAITNDDEQNTVRSSLMYYDESPSLVCQTDYIDNTQTTPIDLMQSKNGSVYLLNNVLNPNWSDHHPLIVKIETPCEGPSIISDVNDHQLDNKLSIYPNPVDQQLNVILDKAAKEVKYQIFNLEGKVVKKGLLSGQMALDVSSFKNGIYVLNVNNNGDFTSIRFIKS